MDLTSYRALGRSGLIVSPMALGTMTFGAEGWGSDEAGARAIFDGYVEAGGNFIDTAEIYAGGRSEEMLGGFVADRKLRDRMVIGTKFTWNQDAGNPNAGGNGRKNILRALEGSLRRLRTDYIDLYWLHFWDMVTPAEEVLQTFADLIRDGRIRYYALSDVPAWYATQMATLATERGLPGPVAVQLEYSLVERTPEQEHIPAGQALGFGFMPWSPLAGGLLAGKYRRDETPAEGRLATANPFGESKFTDRNWAIVDALRQVADETGRSPAEVALAWAAGRSGVSSVIIGASRSDQLKANLAALDLALGSDQQKALDEASRPAPAFPYSGFNRGMRRRIFGGARVTGWTD